MLALKAHRLRFSGSKLEAANLGVLGFVSMCVCLFGPAGLRAQTLYWDTNGSTAGAGGVSPSAIWDSSGASNKNWTAAADGTSKTQKWVWGYTAVFSAGTDATGVYTVTVSGTQNAAGIIVEQGNPTFSGGTALNFNNASGSFDVASGSTATVNMPLAGAGTTFSKTGAGTLVLSGVNSYAGSTNINAGTLKLGANDVLPNTAVTIASGANFNLNNYSETIGSLAGSGTITLGSGTLAVGTNNTDTTFSGSFTGGDTGTFEKIGTGTLTLGAGMNLSAGSLVLNDGTLNLGGFNSTFGSLSVTGDSVLDFGTTDSSVLNILNSLTVASGVTLTIANWSDTVDYFYSLVDPNSTNLGRILFTGYAAGDTKWLTWDHQITPVPEPSTYGALLMAVSTLLAGFLRYRRRTV